jgi:plastocyanin
MGRLLAAVLAIGTLATACGPSGPVATDKVRIFDDVAKPEKDWGYAPGSIRVPLNATVTFTNGGAVYHTVTADVGRLVVPLPGSTAPARAAGRAFDVGANPGERVTVVFDQAGMWPYHCGVHPDMKGVVEVCDGTCK